jgi:beta-lactam-binding protein with PASTA domain
MQEEGGGWFGEYSQPVSLYVTQSTTPTTVPDVLGEIRANARTTIVASDLIPDFHYLNPNVTNVNKTEVFKQQPSPGASVQRGSVVRLDMRDLV